MASNVALKRAKRARQRKDAVAAGRRLAVVESAISVRARRAAQAPIALCALQGELAGGAVEGGIASLVIARGRTLKSLTVAIFLVDTFCLGIKDVIFRDFDAEELAFICEGMSEAAPLAEIEPADARRFLHEAAAWGASVGFKPHRDYVAAEQIFGDVDAAASDAAFTFGQDGKPFYIPGPTETRAQVRQRLAHLLDRFGPGGYDYMIEI